jgi:hypothetical protein
LNRTVSKTVSSARGSRVRIPPSPPNNMIEAKGPDHNETRFVVYDNLPEFSSDDIPSEGGFDFETDGTARDKSEDFLAYYIALAIKNPGWLAVANHTSEYKLLKSQGRPRAKNVHPDDAAALKELGFKTIPELRDIGKMIVQHRYRMSSTGNAMVNRDVVVRAMELISEDYPQLALYRGAEFDSKERYKEGDYAPGDLNMALDHSRVGFAGVRRENPVLVVLPFHHVVREYCQDRLDIGTERDWGFASMEIHLTSRTEQIGTTYKVPRVEGWTAQMKAKYKEKVIDFDKAIARFSARPVETARTAEIPGKVSRFVGKLLRRKERT